MVNVAGGIARVLVRELCPRAVSGGQRKMICGNPGKDGGYLPISGQGDQLSIRPAEDGFRLTPVLSSGEI